MLKLASGKQAYSALQELEGNLGLNPNDPIIPFFLFLGASATLWYFYASFHSFHIVGNNLKVLWKIILLIRFLQGFLLDI